MTIQFANAIVQRLGPCRIALDKAAHAELARELALIGCDIADTPEGGAHGNSNGATAGFLAWTDQESGRFANALRPFKPMSALVLHSAGQNRRAMERALFDAGWQRHPGGMTLSEYPGWSGKALPALSFYQRAPHGGGNELQTCGIEADATIARYAMAANHVRPGDHVLLDGMGSADGAAILMALSRAGSITRVGPQHKRGNFVRNGIEVIDASLSRLGSNSIDAIVAFEPATPDGWLARLDDYARVLKYDGRVVLGWPQGTGPHPRDWTEFSDAVSDRFLTETRYVQIPIGPDPTGPRALFPTALDQVVATDWLLLVASANPLMGEGLADEYHHPAFPNEGGVKPALVDFGGAYDNPYLYRSMVQMGERLGDDLKLARLAECVVEDSRADSADRGAAIAVLGYRVLEMRLVDLVDQVLPLIADYINLTLDDDTPVHVHRWRISLSFLAGRLNELAGDRATAKLCYRMAADGEWARFSALLATKAIAACFFEARLLLADGDSQAALHRFQQGVATALKAAGEQHAQQMGATEKPLPFYLTELAEVIDMGSQCANAVANIDLWHRDPGLFWRQVDVRRFGLASWARDLEQENARLRAA